MLLLTLLRLTLAVGLLVVLPGWLLVNAVFPPHRRKLSWLERGYMVLAGGGLVLILVGCILGLLPHAGSVGFYQTAATGLPNVELATVAACILLGYVGLARGAYPRLAQRWPRLLNPEAKA